ncbi:MAG: YraN family protein [Pseudomonadota bacterium]
MAIEQRVKAYLIEQQLTFIEENYKCKLGEIDLIFKTGQLWVFIEVKFRKDDSHGAALEYFTSRKKSRMIRSIMCFFAERQMNIHDQEIRLDLVAVDNRQMEWLQGIT